MEMKHKNRIRTLQHLLTEGADFVRCYEECAEESVCRPHSSPPHSHAHSRS